jgi:hypothetical protein
MDQRIHDHYWLAPAFMKFGDSFAFRQRVIFTTAVGFTISAELMWFSMLPMAGCALQTMTSHLPELEHRQCTGLRGS